ncbi:hypothetical protein [Natronobacterium texcoconense]|uniref:Uncharacterized protein n=1 Tax=Natronobacterium texcoconense TaxID=1095778 RepID=A0A1H1HPX4_NATTX|nr:hypothetical protein [Natronobacterium texcoconense]SDR27432.1 hypothetical protein SAMN04489842_2942 [Natronobacterium texcoconense]
MTTFSPDDVDKTVESAAGDPLGAVVDVDDETAYVEPDPGVTDSLKATLDWEGSGEAIPLADDAVRKITDDAIRLEAEFPEESLDTGDEGERSEERDGEPASHSPGEPVETTVTETETGVDPSESDVGTGGFDESEPMMADDEFYDDPAEGARVDPSDRIEERDEPIDVDREEIESEASQELEVDPTELTEQEPESEITPAEDVGNRTTSDASSTRADEKADEETGETTEDAGSIDSEMPAASEREQELDEASETEGSEDHELDEGR